jgi:hypothetical protein
MTEGVRLTRKEEQRIYAAVAAVARRVDRLGSHVVTSDGVAKVVREILAERGAHVPAEVLATNERLVAERNELRTEVYRLEGILAQKPNDLENRIAELEGWLYSLGFCPKCNMESMPCLSCGAGL